MRAALRSLKRFLKSLKQMDQATIAHQTAYDEGQNEQDYLVDGVNIISSYSLKSSISAKEFGHALALIRIEWMRLNGVNGTSERENLEWD